MWDHISIPSALESIILLDLTELMCHRFALNHSLRVLLRLDLEWNPSRKMFWGEK